MPPIFCPTCDTLILDAPNCPACGWRRPAEGGTAGVELWRAELGRALPKQASAAIVGGHYCVAAEDGALVALDVQTGQIGWEQAISATQSHALASDGQRLLVSPLDLRALPVGGTQFLALDPADGSIAWRYPTSAHSLSPAAVVGNMAYITSSDGLLHAVDTTGGQPRWRTRHGEWAAGAPAATSTIVCAGGRERVLAAYLTEPGTALWRFEAADSFAGAIRMLGERVYALCWDGYLYALEAGSGRLLWKLKGERGEGFTSPPLLAGDQLFIGSRVYHDRAARAGNNYALLALDATSGAERWRFETAKYVTVAPSLASAQVLFGDDDGSLCAVGASDGQLRWQLKLDARPVTPPQIHGDMVFVGTRAGTVYAVRWRSQPAATLEDPQVYSQRGQPEQAAIAYALRGDLAAAADIYMRDLAQPRRAAQLYERSGQLEPAARLWEQAGEPRRARDLYQKAGRSLEVARLLAGAGELLQAARIYEQQGALERAAALYEHAGDRGKAAELYHRAGHIEQAGQIWQSLGEWERLVDALVEDQQFAAAAEILARQQQFDRAAELYERADRLASALELRIALQHWERAAELAARSGDAHNEAIAHEHLGHALAAAQAYERAARQALAADPAAEESAARLYEQAAQLYDAVLADEDLARCRELVQQLRRLPEISLSGGAQASFVEQEWNTLNLLVKNTGFGPALKIAIAFDDDFDIEGNQVIARLLPDKSAPLEIYLRPKQGQYGQKVPFKIAITFEDRNGGQYATTQRMPLRVLAKGSPPEPQTPLEIDIRSGGSQEVAPGTRTSSARPQDISDQQSRLAIHRRNLSHYLSQQALFGGALVPVNIVNGIEEEQANIARVKAILRGWGVTVADQPDDAPGG